MTSDRATIGLWGFNALTFLALAMFYPSAEALLFFVVFAGLYVYTIRCEVARNRAVEDMLTWRDTADEEFGKGNWHYASGTIMARPGDAIVCEGGHHIVTVAKTIERGDSHDSVQFTNWQQTEPDFGARPVCKICGGRWFKGGYLRFGNGWRL